MGDPTVEADQGALRLDFDRRLRLQFRGSSVTSDTGLLAYRELDDTLRLTDTGAETLADVRSGKNGRHRLAGLLRLRAELHFIACCLRRHLVSYVSRCFGARPNTARNA